MNIIVKKVVVGPVMTNCYLCHLEGEKAGFIVDPGDDSDVIKKMVESEGVEPEGILLTHGHFDHITAAEDMRKMYHAPIYALDKEREVLESESRNLSNKMGRKNLTLSIDHFCRNQEILNIAGMEIEVLATPGHTPGGCCYYISKGNILFSGDTLFKESVGRTDFVGGSMEDIVKSVREKLLILPEETAVLPGHDAPTTIGHERKYNPYVG